MEAFSSPDALSDKTCGGTQPYDDANAYNHSQNDGTGMAPHHGFSGAVDDQDGMANAPPRPPQPDGANCTGWPQPGPNCIPGPSQLWFGMIHPLSSMRFKGAAWYQGEANDGQYASCEHVAHIA